MGVKPNVVLLMVDQMRFDAMGANGNDLISTPTLDMMANEGYNFENAYTAVPSCIPSRAGLLTGLKPENHGRVGYEEGINWDYDKTMASEFTSLGYQTEAIGKMHVYPERNRVGFEHVVLHDGYLHHTRNINRPYGSQYERSDDYLSWLREQQGSHVDLMDLGLDCNSWVARPWTGAERLHPTNWATSEAINFLRRRDPTKPTFLKLSYVRPHSPLDPPEYYFNLYMDKKDQFDQVNVGDWVGYKDYADGIDATRGKLKQDEYDRMIAGYYGSITHIDHQISRLLIAMGEEQMLHNTIFLFLSDHGDQLGEHNIFRKSYPYQGSIHVPFFIYDPGNLLNGSVKKIDELVELRDVFPSLVDLATSESVEGIDGLSFKPSLYDEAFELRPYLHGEHAYGEDSNQFVLTKEWKYIWYSIHGKEQLFNRVEDPNEKQDLAGDLEYADVKADLKGKLVEELKGREEGFVKDGKLVTVEKNKATLNFMREKE